MTNSKLFILGLFLFSTTAKSRLILDKGYRLPSESVSKNFTLMEIAPDENLLTKYIIKTNYKLDTAEAQLIASNIIKVASCFEIDPWVLTGLIQKESSFKRDAVSPTNAAGLTQFTSMGFKEVNDQLGFRGREGATKNATLYFSSKIKDCIDPSWVDLWIKVATPEDDPEFYNLLKEEIKKDVPVAVTYGAILLKTYVAYIDNKTKKGDTPLSIGETYYQALQIYNGEEGDSKVRYAKGIFKNIQDAYPAEATFPFIPTE